MAVTKITWENKTGIQNDASVARKNKVVDEDMNEIKQVVNNNADEVTTMQETIEDLQEGQGTSDTDITNLKNRVTTLEKDNTENKSDITTLKTDNETNKSDIAELQEQFSNFENYDDTEIKQDISDIKKEQQTQNSDIENLQTNDTKQDELISKLQEDNQKLKNAALNAETEEAKSLHVTDANKFGQLEVLGNHEQEMREGYNLLNLKTFDEKTSNGITCSQVNNSSVKFNGTANAISNFWFNDLGIILSAGTYKFKLNESIYGIAYFLKDTDGANILQTALNENTFDLKEEKTFNQLLIQVSASISLTNKEINLMIYKGTEEKEYEQYGPSPSPDYPSEVKCLGSNKQLFDKSTAVEGLLQGDGTLSYSDNNYSTSDFIKVVPKKSYYKTITGSSRFKFFDEEKSPISSTYNDLIDPTKAQSFEIPENAHYIRFTFLKTYIDEIKIEEGTEATSYSPIRTR